MIDEKIVKDYYDFYLKTKSILETSKKFKACTKTLKKLFEFYEFKYPLENFNRKFNFDENFFENIDSEIKAYLLGFIYADGCIYKRCREKNGCESVLKINLKIDDIKILQMFKEHLKYEGELSFIKERDFINPSEEKYTRLPQAIFSLSSKKIVSDLESYGLGVRKTYMNLNLPKIKNCLIWHFIRGYFDGDGCICNYLYKNSIKYTSRKTRIITTNYFSSPKTRISLTSKTETLLKDLKEFLKLNKITSVIHFSKKRKCFTLNINRTEDCKSFCSNIYDNANYYLNRKFLKYVQLKSDELLENPEMDNQQPSLELNAF